MIMNICQQGTLLMTFADEVGKDKNCQKALNVNIYYVQKAYIYMYVLLPPTSLGYRSYTHENVNNYS